MKKQNASGKAQSSSEFTNQQLELIEKYNITIKGDDPVLVRASRFQGIPSISDKDAGTSKNYEVVSDPHLYETERDGSIVHWYITNLLVCRHGMKEQMVDIIKNFAEPLEITRGEETKTVPAIDIRLLNECLLTHNIYPNKDGVFPTLPQKGNIVKASVVRKLDDFTGEYRLSVSSIETPESTDHSDTVDFDLASLI